jgi:hypothetical protein
MFNNYDSLSDVIVARSCSISSRLFIRNGYRSITITFEFFLRRLVKSGDMSERVDSYCNIKSGVDASSTS